MFWTLFESLDYDEAYKEPFINHNIRCQEESNQSCDQSVTQLFSKMKSHLSRRIKGPQYPFARLIELLLIPVLLHNNSNNSLKKSKTYDYDSWEKHITQQFVLMSHERLLLLRQVRLLGHSKWISCTCHTWHLTHFWLDILISTE